MSLQAFAGLAGKSSVNTGNNVESFKACWKQAGYVGTGQAAWLTQLCPPIEGLPHSAK